MKLHVHLGLAGIAATILLSGCGRRMASTANAGGPQAVEVLSARIRTGAAQLETVLDQLDALRNDLLDALKGASKLKQEGIQETVDLIDDAATTIVNLDLNAGLPVDKARALKRVMSLAQGAEDAATALHNAQGILASLNGTRNAKRIEDIALSLDHEAEVIRGTAR